jgi:thiamine-phosphate pyrophosphorylase
LPAAAENPRTEPIVCYVTQGISLNSADPGRSVLEKIRAAVAARVDWVQIREKDLPAQKLLALVRAAVGVASDGDSNVRVIVNDRLDVAIAAGAAGVHLGSESLPAGKIVRWCRAGNAPPEFLVGVSGHTFENVREAEDAGASYAFFGPVFDTPAKRPFGPPQGIARLAKVCRGAKIPVIAIGGVNEENGEECMRAGAAGIAAIRLFQEPREAALKNAVERLRGFAATR